MNPYARLTRLREVTPTMTSSYKNYPFHLRARVNILSDGIEVLQLLGSLYPTVIPPPARSPHL